MRLARPGLALMAVLLLTSCAAAPQATADTPTSSGTPTFAACAPGAELVGPSTAELQRALDGAEPGDVLQLSPVTYTGSFKITASGSSEAPITMCGSLGSELRGDGVESSATVLRLDGVSHWRVSDVSIGAAATGILVSDSDFNELRRLSINDLGFQGIRVENGSTNNIIVDSQIGDTGVTDRERGEGIIIGTAKADWCDVTACEPDASDLNLVVGNAIDHTAGEAISAEEGTSAGVIRENSLSRGDGTSDEAVVDLKGNGWVFAQNSIGDAAGPGVQVHSFLPEWGLGNRITANTFGGSPADLSIEVIGTAAIDATDVSCDNTMTWGPDARSNVDCS